MRVSEKISPHPRGRSWLRGTSLSLAVALAVATTAAETPSFPHPLDGPGAPTLTKSQTKKIDKAWNRLQAGRTADAAKAARKVSDTLAGRLLSYQIRFVESEASSIADLMSFCANNPDYSAAWATLAAAMEPVGDEAATLATARRVRELWPDSSWGRQAGQLEAHWIGARIARANELIDGGQPEGALELLDAALDLQPMSEPALTAKAEILRELGRTAEAEQTLAPIAARPEVRMELARWAEEDGRLYEAMRHYTAVPEGTPGRDQALRRVKLEWRRQNLPAYVQTALASEDLSRAELAVVLVGLVPEANAIAGGEVPLLSDIVDLPSQREVVTAVRLGLMNVDNLQHQFNPDEPADPGEARFAVERLCQLLDLDPPPWCTDSSTDGGTCARLERPMSGRALADVILQATHWENP